MAAKRGARNRTPRRLDVYLEVGTKRVFAGALDWPGWCRSGRDEDAALEALAAYRSRYARALTQARLRPAPAVQPTDLRVAERLEGNATTDFGAPAIAPSKDQQPVASRDAKRLRALLEAAWAAFDEAALAAKGKPLRTGPRGGGRQVEAMIEHVLGAEEAYLGKLGGVPRRANDADVGTRMRAVRDSFLDTFARRARGEPAPRTPRSGSLWAPRYALRRSGWHALDHAWEIEDRLPAP